MGGRNRVVHMTLLVYVLALSVRAEVAGHEEPELQSRIERFLQETFQPAQFFGASSGASSPPPGPPQSLTPIPRDSSLAKAVLTGQGPGRRLMSFAAMRPLYTSAFGDAAALGNSEEGTVVRQQPYSRGLLQRLSGGSAAQGEHRMDAGQDSGPFLRVLDTRR